MNFDDIINATVSHADRSGSPDANPTGSDRTTGQSPVTNPTGSHTGEDVRNPADNPRKLRAAGLAATRDGRAAVMSAGKSLYHRLGTVVQDAPSIEEAMKISGIAGRDIHKQQTYVRIGDELHATDQCALVRGDTNTVLPGAVGHGYEVVADEEVYRMLDGLGKNMRYHTAGVLGRGEKSWMLAKMEDMTTNIGGTDTVESYVLFISQHGCGSIMVIPTSIRVACSNSLNAAIAAGRKKCLSFRHTKNVRVAMTGAIDALRDACDDLRDVNTRAKRLAESRIDKPLEYFGLCIDHILETTIAGQPTAGKSHDQLLNSVLAITDGKQRIKETAALRRLEQKRGSLLDKIVAMHNDTYSNRGDSLDGTAWLAANAVTDVLQHDNTVIRHRGNDETRAENRFASLVDGRLANMSEYAFQLADNMATAR